MGTAKNNFAEENGLAQQYKALQELGDCYTSVGDYAHAQRCYEKAASLEPDEPGPYVGLGTVALEKKQFEDAEIAFKVALRLNKSCAKAYCGLAFVYQERADFAKAFEMYLKCLELDSDNLKALLGLFQTSRQMGSFAKVRHYLQVYLKMHPGDTKVMFCLATLYMKDGRLNEAKKTLSDVLALDTAYTDASNLLEEVEHELNKEDKEQKSKPQPRD